jgi:hypothetical protein
MKTGTEKSMIPVRPAFSLTIVIHGLARQIVIFVQYRKLLKKNHGYRST